MKRFSVLLAAFVFVGVTNAYGNEKVVNGDFTDTQGDNEAAPPWVMDEDPNNEYAGGIDSGRFQKSGFTNREGNVPGSNGGVWFRSFEGNNGSNPGDFVDLTVTQSLNGLVAGNTYTFLASVRHQFNHISDSATASLGGDLNFDLKAGVPRDNLWYDLSTTFTYTGGSSDLVLSFVNGEDAGIPGEQSFIVDNVSVVPEPTSLALLSLGFVGLLGRRRKV